MRKYKNVSGGPVDVPALGLVDVDPDAVVEVHDPAIADGMDSSGTWEHLPDPKRSKAAKKAAATRADDSSSNDTEQES